jgi:hypothetical protein
MPPPLGATDDKYWAEYDGLQYAKHQLLSKYLAGWLPILAGGSFIWTVMPAVAAMRLDMKARQS